MFKIQYNSTNHETTFLTNPLAKHAVTYSLHSSAGIGAKTIEERVIVEAEFLVDAIQAHDGKAFVPRVMV